MRLISLSPTRKTVVCLCKILSEGTFQFFPPRHCWLATTMWLPVGCNVDATYMILRLVVSNWWFWWVGGSFTQRICHIHLQVFRQCFSDDICCLHSPRHGGMNEPVKWQVQLFQSFARQCSLFSACRNRCDVHECRKNSSMELVVIWGNFSCSDLACSDLACSDLACSDLAHSNLAHSDLAHSDLARSDLAHFFCQNSYFFHSIFTTWELI